MYVHESSHESERYKSFSIISLYSGFVNGYFKIYSFTAKKYVNQVIILRLNSLCD